MMSNVSLERTSPETERMRQECVCMSLTPFCSDCKRFELFILKHAVTVFFQILDLMHTQISTKNEMTMRWDERRHLYQRRSRWRPLMSHIRSDEWIQISVLSLLTQLLSRRWEKRVHYYCCCWGGGGAGRFLYDFLFPKLGEKGSGALVHECEDDAGSVEFPAE